MKKIIRRKQQDGQKTFRKIIQTISIIIISSIFSASTDFAIISTLPSILTSDFVSSLGSLALILLSSEQFLMVRICFAPFFSTFMFLVVGLMGFPFWNHFTSASSLFTSHSRTTVSPFVILRSVRGTVNLASISGRVYTGFAI